VTGLVLAFLLADVATRGWVHTALLGGVGGAAQETVRRAGAVHSPWMQRRRQRLSQTRFGRARLAAAGTLRTGGRVLVQGVRHGWPQGHRRAVERLPQRRALWRDRRARMWRWLFEGTPEERQDVPGRGGSVTGPGPVPGSGLPPAPRTGGGHPATPRPGVPRGAGDSTEDSGGDSAGDSSGAAGGDVPSVEKPGQPGGDSEQVEQTGDAPMPHQTQDGPPQETTVVVPGTAETVPAHIQAGLEFAQQLTDGLGEQVSRLAEWATRHAEAAQALGMKGAMVGPWQDVADTFQGLHAAFQQAADMAMQAARHEERELSRAVEAADGTTADVDDVRVGALRQ
jgi:hypothetical protein